MYGQMVYVILAGISLLFFPNMLLGIFDIAPTNEVWIRVLGLLVLILSIYYYHIAHYGNDKIVWATIVGRLVFCIGLLIFVIIKLAPISLIGFATLEMILTVWAWREIKQ